MEFHGRPLPNKYLIGTILICVFISGYLSERAYLNDGCLYLLWQARQNEKTGNA